MVFVLWKLVKCELWSGNGIDKNGCKVKGDGDCKKDMKDDDFSN